jgi:hypothetical protein
MLAFLVRASRNENRDLTDIEIMRFCCVSPR